MARYRKRPVVIDAIQWTGDNETALRGWLEESVPSEGVDGHPYTLRFVADGSIMVRTLEGAMKASRGDWIIRGVAGEVYPCKPDIFEETYEPVVE